MAAISSGVFHRRMVMNKVALALSMAAMVFGLFWLGWILFTLLREGLAALSPTLFTEMTPPPGETGGLLNAIFGSLVMTFLATLIGTPIGIAAGIYLAEYGQKGPFASTTRFINQTLLSAPSVIIGFFVYAALVLPMKQFSAWAGAFSLMLILIPVVVSSTENMLRLVPGTLREASAALGAPQWKTISFVSMKAARPGVITGILLAVARISGETAPLLFTALNNQFWSTDLSAPMANLPVVIFQFAMSPYEDWQELAWAGAILITFAVLLLNMVARIIFRKKMQVG